MIGTRFIGAGGFVRRLADKAETLALAHVETRRRRHDPRRWRRAALLWPLFAKDNR